MAQSLRDTFRLMDTNVVSHDDNRRILRRSAWLLGMALVLAACAPATNSPAPSTAPSTPASASASAPASSPVATGRIAFDRFETQVGWEAPFLGAFTAPINGLRGEAPITVNAKVDSLTPIWSPDGMKLAVSIYAPPEIPGRPAIVNPDGSGLTVLTPPTLSGSLGCSDWSPDGRKLLCTVDNDADTSVEGIYEVNADGSGMRRLTVSPYPSKQGTAGVCGGNDFGASYSPDGSRFAFVRLKCGVKADPSDDQAAAIFVEKVDGTGETQVVAYGVANSHAPAVRWSPRGNELLFGSEDGTLTRVSTDGSTLTPFALQGLLSRSFAYAPVWSPDGSLILFSLWTQEAQTTNLYTAKPDGTELTQVTNAAGAETFASWTR